MKYGTTAAVYGLTGGALFSNKGVYLGIGLGLAWAWICGFNAQGNVGLGLTGVLGALVGGLLLILLRRLSQA